jgi:hypothetical protein
MSVAHHTDFGFHDANAPLEHAQFMSLALLLAGTLWRWITLMISGDDPVQR